MDSGLKQLVTIGLKLTRYRNGILNYFSHPVANAVAQGLNNKIKTLKHQAYCFRDIEYFKLRLCHLHIQRNALSG